MEQDVANQSGELEEASSATRQMAQEIQSHEVRLERNEVVLQDHTTAIAELRAALEDVKMELRTLSLAIGRVANERNGPPGTAMPTPKPKVREPKAFKGRPRS